MKCVLLENVPLALVTLNRLAQPGGAGGVGGGGLRWETSKQHALMARGNEINTLSRPAWVAAGTAAALARLLGGSWHLNHHPQETACTMKMALLFIKGGANALAWVAVETRVAAVAAN